MAERRRREDDAIEVLLPCVGERGRASCGNLTYFSHLRLEMVSFVPQTATRILDVGCGVGAFGEFLRKTRNAQVDGVEIVPTIALEAAKRLDKVFVGAFGDALSLPIGEYDCVVFNDVLEHMIDPVGALEYTRTF